MTYLEFLTLIDEFSDQIMLATIRHERDRPEQEQLEARTAAVKAKNALWDAIRLSLGKGGDQ